MDVPPGPRGLAAWRFLGIGRPAAIVGYLRDVARTYGPLASFRVFGQRVAIVDDAALIGEILQHRQHLFVRDVGAVLLRELVGDGVLTTDDPAHLVRRRLLQPAFHRARVAAYGTAMVDAAERTADAWLARGNGAFDLGAEMTRLTLAIVGDALFGTDVGARASVVAEVIASISSRGGRLQPFLAPLAPVLLALRRRSKRPSRLVFGAERRTLERVVDPLVAERRAAGVDRGDLLSTLLAARDDAGRGLADNDVRNELITFVLAGHETTASALGWAWYELARNPAAEARLHDELDRVLGGRAPAMDDLARLPYAAAVFDEALRLYPPAAAFGRRPVADVELGGYRLPRGSSVFVSPYVTHRNPRYFANPDAFEPERWFGPAPPKFAYFPFGGGSKMCLGEGFARAEGVLVLATIARRLRLSLAQAVPVTTNAQALLRPERPILMRAAARDAAGDVAASRC